jgi:hypothetical protein
VTPEQAGALMPSGSLPPADCEFLASVLDHYWSLIAFAGLGASSGGDRGLGGQLLYAGELSDEKRAIVVAANVAGAATLAATEDAARQRQAMHDGIVDFAVNALDEALRILKNQIRKRETVAVCVAHVPQAMEREMHERGLAPDLVAGEWWSEKSGSKARTVRPIPVADDQALVSWSVAAAPAQWLPKLDAMALDCLEDDAWVERRWVRLAPRFLGRMARAIRALRCEPEVAEKFVRRAELATFRGEIGVPVEIEVTRKGVSERRRFSPAGPPRRMS